MKLLLDEDSQSKLLARLLREARSEEHTSELQSQSNLVCRLLLEKKKKQKYRSESVGKSLNLRLSETRSIRPTYRQAHGPALGLSSNAPHWSSARVTSITPMHERS